MPRSLRITLIDDNPIDLALMAAAFRECGTVTAHQACPRIDDDRVDWDADVFIIDDRLGPLTANDTIPLLKKAIRPSTRLFVMSASLTPKRRVRLRQLGAEAAFEKGEIEELRAMICAEAPCVKARTCVYLCGGPAANDAA